jgi:hypothetical protein
MGAAVTALDAALVTAWPSGGLLPQIVRLGLDIGAALGVLSAAAWLLRIREFREGVALVSRRFRRGRA